MRDPAPIHLLDVSNCKYGTVDNKDIGYRGELFERWRTRHVEMCRHDIREIVDGKGCLTRIGPQRLALVVAWPQRSQHQVWSICSWIV